MEVQFENSAIVNCFTAWQSGAKVDPDRAIHTNRVDGTTGKNIATLQNDQFKTHNHYGGSDLVTFDGSGGIGSNSASMSEVAPTTVGGNETRPKNIYMMWCIKY